MPHLSGARHWGRGFRAPLSGTRHWGRGFRASLKWHTACKVLKELSHDLRALTGDRYLRYTSNVLTPLLQATLIARWSLHIQYQLFYYIFFFSVVFSGILTPRLNTIVSSCSVDPRKWKLCVGVKYYIVHMYSMPYYTYGSTANFLFLEPTVLTYIYQKNGAVTRIYVVLEILKLNK